jgi:5-methylcytosine-specific restriction protein A
MLFTREQGHQYGYEDSWIDEGIFLYTGEGQTGDMTFARGNLAIRDHVADGKDLHLFEYVQPGQVRYAGQMVCTGFQEKAAPDRAGQWRRIIIFELTPIDAFKHAGIDEEDELQELWAKPLNVLRERALATSTMAKEPLERRKQSHHRSTVVRAYVLKRANGLCEGCRKEAPFRTSTGRPYLEPHHLRRQSDGGPDHPRWVAALCPNCHCRAHYGADKQMFNELLFYIVSKKESIPVERSP